MQMSLLGLYDYQHQEEMALMKKQTIQWKIKFSLRMYVIIQMLFLENLDERKNLLSYDSA